jgi:hypothetical protein
MHDNDALDFLGIYYTLFPEKIKDANRYPIQSVTFDGDVTLVADNEAVSFVAVQPFETAKIKTKWSRSDNVSLNCAKSENSNGSHRTMSNMIADFSHFDQDGTVDLRVFPQALQKIRVLVFFSNERPKKMVYFRNGVLITTSGSLLVDADRFPNICLRSAPDRLQKSPFLLHQLCRLIP